MSNYTGSDEDMAMGKLLRAAGMNWTDSWDYVHSLYVKFHLRAIWKSLSPYRQWEERGYGHAEIMFMLYAHHMKISGSTPVDPVVSTDQ